MCIHIEHTLMIYSPTASTFPGIKRTNMGETIKICIKVKLETGTWNIMSDTVHPM